MWPNTRVTRQDHNTRLFLLVHVIFTKKYLTTRDITKKWNMKDLTNDRKSKMNHET